MDVSISISGGFVGLGCDDYWIRSNPDYLNKSSCLQTGKKSDKTTHSQIDKY